MKIVDLCRLEELEKIARKEAASFIVEEKQFICLK